MTQSDQLELQIERIVKRMLGAVRVSVAAQDDGTTTSDGHRVINFRGPGVQVTDNPALRRVDVYVPGLPLGSTTATTVASTAGSGRATQLATSATSPPANWETTGFNDSGWSTVVAETVTSVFAFTPIAGTVWITERTGNVAQDVCFLHRRTFTLPSETISGATLQLQGDDDLLDIYINGSRLGGASGLYQFTADVSPAILLPGSSSNVLAVRVRNNNPGTTGPYGVDYLLTVNSGAAVITGTPYVCIRDEKSANTNGGASSTGSWLTRALNTEHADTGSLASVASNQITLAAGSYICRARAPAYRGARNKLRLQNITDTATLLNGDSNYVPAGAGLDAHGIAHLSGRFTIAATKTIELQHQFGNADALGLGVASNFGVTEIYAVVELWKDG